MFPSSSPKRNRAIISVTPVTFTLLYLSPNMEGPLKELAKLEKLTSKLSQKGKSPSIPDSLDSLTRILMETKAAADDGTLSEHTLESLAQTIDLCKKEVDERQKEIYGSISRFGKALDKVQMQPTG